MIGKRLPRVACVGLGWIGLHRLEALVGSGLVNVIAVADSDPAVRDRALALTPGAEVFTTLDEVLALEPDGIVLATPSALHAPQSLAALSAGAAVFCQKPLGRTASEVRTVIDAAHRANRLLAVDVSYRYTEGLTRLRDSIREGGIGAVYAADLTFHNAYGPDKAWFYDIRQAGGGCLLDLGVHLVDFLHWTIDAPVTRVSGLRFARGRRLEPADEQVEDFAVGEIELSTGALARIACSWNLSAGCDAVIGITVYGTEGALAFRNVNGSFYDFIAECYRGTHTEVLTSPPDLWGGRAIVAWAQQLSRSASFDPQIETAWRVAATLDQLYGRPLDGGGFGPHVDREHAPHLRV